MNAGFCRGGLEATDRADPELGRRVRAAMDPNILDATENASRLAWLPVAYDVEMTRALFTVAGPARAQAVFRDAMVAALQGPLLKSLFAAAAVIFDNTLKDVFAWTPRVWSTIYRDAGTMKVVDMGPTAVDFVLSDLPQVICDNPNYLLGLAANFEAAFVLLKVKGSTTISSKPDARQITLHASWSAPQK